MKINKNFVLVFVLLSSLVGATAYTLIGQNQTPAEAAWFDYSWQYKKKITIDHTKVGETLTDFPVLINLDSDADLASYAQDDGDDILFTLSDETAKLSHEIELFDGATGQLVAWVKVPSLSSTVDTELYLYYGNSSATDQQDASGVWSNGYAAVWHMNQDPGPGGSGDILDSSGNGNHGTATADMTSADLVDSKIGKGIDFDGTGDWMEISDSDTLANNTFSGLTLQSWLYINSISWSDRTAIMDKYDWAANDRGYTMQLGENGSSNKSALAISLSQSPTSMIGKTTLGSSQMAAGQYYRTAVTWEANHHEIIVDNTEEVDDTDTAIADSVANNSESVWLGRHIDEGTALNGILDEVRISNVARSAGWLSTEYNNQNSPPTFYLLEGQDKWDIVAPTNPTTFKTYSSSSKTIEYQSTDWLNAPSPYFEWSGAGDEGGSGVDGYYLYLGTDPAANPELTSGIIESDNSPYYTTGTNFTLSEPMTEDTTYYFRIKTMDQAYNISDPSTTFTYSFETGVPDPPDFINVSPAGCSTSPDFSFSWLAPSDNGDSGISDYQYKKGANGEISSTPLLTLSETSYQDSDNVLYLRSRDRAGNVSTWQTAVYCSIEAPRIIEGPFVTPNPSSLIVSWRSSKETTSHIEVYDGNTYLSEFGRNTLSIEHSVTVLGLKAEKSYRYRLSWKDSGNNLNYSDWYETQTSTAPQIQNLNIQTLSANSMLLNFSTNYTSTASIGYGLDSYDRSYSFSSPASSFSHQIEGLSQGTTYKLRIIAIAEDGTEYALGESFTTPPLPQISLLKYSFLPDTITTTAEFTWTTNIDTTSSIFYKKEGESQYRELSTSDKTQDHKIVVKDLQDSSSYTFYAGGIDEYGNTGRSPQQSFQTPLDSRAPIISNIIIETSNVGLSNIEEAQIVVSWQSDEPSTSQIEYTPGILSSDYSHRTVTDSNLTKSHIVVVSGLDENTPYNIRVVSADAAGNTSYSSGQVVIPGEARKSILTIILNAFRNAFGWMGQLL